jgi:hypothetical protein
MAALSIWGSFIVCYIANPSSSSSAPTIAIGTFLDNRNSPVNRHNEFLASIDTIADGWMEWRGRFGHSFGYLRVGGPA